MPRLKKIQSYDEKGVNDKARRKEDNGSSLRVVTRWLLENQIGLSINLLALLFLTHTIIPKARPYTSKFFTLSHLNPLTQKYASGPDDLYFKIFIIVLLTGLRAGFLSYILAPLGRRWGISKPKDVVRFSEQAWNLMYYSICWPLSMYMYIQSPYFLNNSSLWSNWPERELSWLMKVYILAQWSYYIQQIVVLHIEDRRKDHWQMLIHHIVTVALISASYAYHQTRVGHLILVLMDFIDLVFPLAKCFKYLGYNRLCDITFGIFILSWIITRHIFYSLTCWSLYTDAPRLIPSACYHGRSPNVIGPLPIPSGSAYLWEPFRDPGGLVCWSESIKGWFLAFLCALQVILIMWFVLIMRVAMKVIRGASAEDVRSDGEEEDEVLDIDEGIEEREEEPIEEEVGVEAIDFKEWEGKRGGGKRPASSSGLSLAGHSEYKELLNRVGCEKQID